ncbi:RagB/SusD family nutrient uptake outer membrane protein [Thermophagus sp. OGC60D27]|uniref:RagB/SusD family nutrient uptake outer membrane protein n=1 Tax=Thermophagus sp. OGC60D27 TaxID=3458415 RepID=UPI0040377BD2
MNRIKYIIAAIIGVVIISSCSDYLDKEMDTELDIEMVFDNKTKVESWLAGVYSGIPNPGMEWLNTAGWEIFADDLTPSRRWQQWDWPNIPKIFGEWTPNTQWGAGYWQKMPQLIRQAYIFIDRVHAIPDADLPQKEVDYMKAECRFLAAYYYWLLVKTYGPIPFKPDYITPTDFNLSDLMIGQTPFDEIIDYLDQEMLEAAKELPPSYQSMEKYGRVTSVMCLTIRSKMLLFAASPLVNGNEWYEGHVNSNNEPLFNTTYDPAKWERAADACKLLLQETQKAGHELFVQYNDDGTIDPFTSLEDMFWTDYYEGNREILFPYTKKDDWNNFKYYTTKAVTPEFGGGGGLGVYQGLVDAFFTKNGLPINHPNSGYTETGFSDHKEVRNTSWTGGTGNPGEITSSGTYNMYCNREPRFYTTVSYNGSWYALAERKFDFFKNGMDNNYTHDAPQNGYLVRKKIFPTDNPRDNRWKWRQPFLYRLAGSYLDFSEAINEAYNTGDARREAIKYLNMVRERAGIRQYTFDAVDPADANFIRIEDDQDAVRKAIRMERRVELCAEGSRWDDIRRWKIAEELPEVTGAGYGMNFSGENASEFYKRTEFQSRIWEKAYYWFPIFISELEKNQNLIQAPFWK